MMHHKQMVLDILSTGGKYNSKKLGHMVGIATPNVRRIVNELRCEGIPICSSYHGYYISHDPREIQKTIASLEHRTTMMQCTINGLRMTMGEER